MKERVLAVVCARGGSKGLPGKNVRVFAGHPLIAHSLMFAKLCPEITRTIVSTDSPEIAAVARAAGGEVLFLRPAVLARDDTPIWPVLRHALEEVEKTEADSYDYLVLLDPTSPAREPDDMKGALARLRSRSDADGVVAVATPHFNPVWHCVVERDGLMVDFAAEGARFERRQTVPAVYYITGALYLWRTEFVRREKESWRRGGRHLLLEIPETRAMSIDTLEEFERAELLVNGGLVKLAWLGTGA